MSLPTTIRDRSIDRTTAAVVAIVLAALAVRLAFLGERVAQYDEGWVGYWTLRYLATGAWEYRPIVHGPFLVHVNAVVFGLVGASDAAARLVVALLGGSLPAAALLFRERIGDAAAVALALLLAANPLLVYYSRFMRFDVPLAAFAFVTLGLVVRLADTREPRYLYAAAVPAALAATTKESWVLYVLAWAGAGALLVDYRLLVARHGERDAMAVVRSRGRQAVAVGREWWPHAVLAGALFLVVTTLFYAPRPALWRAATDPLLAVDVFGRATWGTVEKLLEKWLFGGLQEHAYLPYLTDTLRTLWAGAPAVVLLAPVGFLLDRYRGARPDDLVAATTYVGGAFVVGFPLANFLPVPWSTVHAVVALSVPAAVGAAWVYRRGRAAVRADRYAPAAVAALLLLAVGGQAAATVVETSYVHPHESPRGDPGSEVVYYSQPPAALGEVLPVLERAAATDGPDVLYYGETLAVDDEGGADRPPAPGGWYARIPLPWYTEQYGADVVSSTDPDALASPPPVVVTTPDGRGYVAPSLSGYRARTVPLDDVGDRKVVVFVDRDLLDDPAAWNATDAG